MGILTARPRAVWIAGTRGETLLLGPAILACHRGHNCLRENVATSSRAAAGAPLGWLCATGEHGTAAVQAQDFLNLTPDEQASICHPGDESAARLRILLERIESFARTHKANAIIFTGFGSAAAAAALVCHARGHRGLWLRPPDPLGQVRGLRWESGLEGVIRACIPPVEVFQIPALPDLLSECDPQRLPFLSEAAPRLEEQIPGLRTDSGMLLISVQRREWGIASEVAPQLVKTAAAWAAAHSDVDFVMLSNLNARLEMPYRALAERPPNFLLAPPLPYPVYRALLARTGAVLTDSPLIACEAWQEGKRIALLGDKPSEQNITDRVLRLQPSDLDPPMALALLGDAQPNMEIKENTAGSWPRSVQKLITDKTWDWLAAASCGSVSLQ